MTRESGSVVTCIEGRQFAVPFFRGGGNTERTLEGSGRRFRCRAKEAAVRFGYPALSRSTLADANRKRPDTVFLRRKVLSFCLNSRPPVGTIQVIHRSAFLKLPASGVQSFWMRKVIDLCLR